MLVEIEVQCRTASGVYISVFSFRASGGTCPQIMKCLTFFPIIPSALSTLPTPPFLVFPPPHYTPLAPWSLLDPHTHTHTNYTHTTYTTHSTHCVHTAHTHCTLYTAHTCTRARRVASHDAAHGPASHTGVYESIRGSKKVHKGSIRGQNGSSYGVHSGFRGSHISWSDSRQDTSTVSDRKYRTRFTF